MKVLGIIPARGGSKGIPRKNIKLLNGKPLISYSIRAARESRLLDRVVVSTEDEEIAATARAFGAEVVMRPADLARDDTPTLAVLQRVVSDLRGDCYECDAVMTLQPTSPLRTARHIDEAIRTMGADPLADSLVSCVAVPHNFTPSSLMRLSNQGYLTPYLEGAPITRRQEKEVLYARNGAAIYLTRVERLANYVFGGRLLPYYMDAEASVDIDTMEDWARAAAILQQHTGAV